MKKQLVLIMLMSMFAVAAVTSCSKDKDKDTDETTNNANNDNKSPNSALVGTWRSFSGGVSSTTDFSEFVFNADNTGSRRIVSGGITSNTSDFEITRWVISGTKVVTDYRLKNSSGEPKTVMMPFSIAGNELTLDGALFLKQVD